MFCLNYSGVCTPQLELSGIDRPEGAVAKTEGKVVSAHAEPEQAEAFSSVRPDMRQPVCN